MDNRKPTVREAKLLKRIDECIHNLARYLPLALEFDEKAAAGFIYAGKLAPYETIRTELQRYNSALKYAYCDEMALIAAIKTGKVTPDMLDRLEDLYAEGRGLDRTVNELQDSAETDRNHVGALLKTPKPAAPGTSGSKIDIPGPTQLSSKKDDINLDLDLSLKDRPTSATAEVFTVHIPREKMAQSGAKKAEVYDAAKDKDLVETKATMPEKPAAEADAKQTTLAKEPWNIYKYPSVAVCGQQASKYPGEIAWLVDKSSDTPGSYIIAGLYSSTAARHPSNTLGLPQLTFKNLLMVARVKVSMVKDLVENDVLGHISVICLMDAYQAADAFAENTMQAMVATTVYVPAVGNFGTVRVQKFAGELRKNEPVRLDIDTGADSGETKGCLSTTLYQIVGKSSKYAGHTDMTEPLRGLLSAWNRSELEALLNKLSNS